MWTRWKAHLWAVGILGASGLFSLLWPPAIRLSPEGSWLPEQVPGTVGTRFFGYGALVLLAVALAIGPMARLQPRRFSRLISHRRAIGVWSAIAGAVHLLFVLQLVSFEFYDRTWLTLFVAPHLSEGLNGRTATLYLLPMNPTTIAAWTGLLALALLLTIALISNNTAQRFLGQATWKLVQQWSYTAFLFVTLHLLVMRFGGKLKLSPPLAQWAFWLLGATALLQTAGFLYTIWKRRWRDGKDSAA